MELRDLAVTPIIIILVYLLAYLIRPYVTDSINRRYFFPGLTIRIIGAIALGVVYQFYYSGGDTFNFHTHGSRVIWETMIDSPEEGLKLLFYNGGNGAYEYESRIYFIRDPSSFFVIRIAAILDLITFSSYSATAVLFSVFSFAGMWMFFLTFYKQYPHLHKGFAFASFFIPSVFYWGGGLLKDTLILGSLGMATYQAYQIFFERKISFTSIAMFLFALYIIYAVKVFILQAYLPSIIVWIVARNFHVIRSFVLKTMLVPVVFSLVIVSSYYSILKIGESNTKYSISNFTKTAQVTAYDIRFWTGRKAGSGYTLDVSSWTPSGMLVAAPSAINVALFRPYLWEVNNPLMLISSLECTFLLIFTLYVFVTNFRHLWAGLVNYNVLFCLVFSMTMAFAVGISTFNFGTLMRYKIPLLPFFVVFLIILKDYTPARRSEPIAELKLS